MIKKEPMNLIMNFPLHCDQQKNKIKAKCTRHQHTPSKPTPKISTLSPSPTTTKKKLNKNFFLN